MQRYVYQLHTEEGRAVCVATQGDHHAVLHRVIDHTRSAASLIASLALQLSGGRAQLTVTPHWLPRTCLDGHTVLRGRLANLTCWSWLTRDPQQTRPAAAPGDSK